MDPVISPYLTNILLNGEETKRPGLLRLYSDGVLRHVISVEGVAQPMRPVLHAPLPPTLEHVVCLVYPLVIVGRVLTHVRPVPRLEQYGVVLLITNRGGMPIILDVGDTILGHP
jgi:hypothetical protein